MHKCIVLIIVVLLSFSCKTVQLAQSETDGIDTVQFTYLYSEALKFKMLENNEKAKELFLKCLSINKESTASAYQLSEIYFDENDFLSSKKYCEFCLEKKPNQEWYLLQRAKLAEKLNEKDRYSAIYQKLVRLFPDNISYAFELAVIYYNEKKYTESLKILGDIEGTTGVDENISFLRNNIFYDTNRLDALQAELLKLKVFFPDSTKYMDMLADFYLNTNQNEMAFNLYHDILKRDTGNYLAYYGLAMVYGKLKEFSKGFGYLNLALKSETININRKEDLAELYLDAKQGALSDEQIGFIYQNLMNEKNVSIDVVNDYLEYMFNHKQLTNTEKLAKQSINSKPDNYWAWYYLINIFIIQSRYEELNLNSLKALEYFPNHSQFYFYAGYSFFIVKKYAEAVKYFESGKEYNVDNKELDLQFMLYLAESYHSLAKHKKSDEYFDLYLENDSSNANLMNNYAYYLTSRNTDLEKAKRISLKSIELEPFNSSFLDTYSWIMYNQKNYSEAFNYIQRSYRYGGNKNFKIVEHYGDILEKMGNAKEALGKYREAYSLNENNENLIQKIKLLENRSE